MRGPARNPPLGLPGRALAAAFGGRRGVRETEEYRAEVERRRRRRARGDVRLGMWSHEDIVVVRGRLRTRRGGVLDDSRMYLAPPGPGREGRVDVVVPRPRRAAGGGGSERRLASEAVVGLHE